MFSDLDAVSMSSVADTTTSDEQKSSSQGRGDREPVQVMLVGSNEGVDSVIKGLHSLGFAKVGDWS